MSKKDAPAKHQERRMAVPTEDHPLDYADFEGVIIESEYGGRRKPVSSTPIRALGENNQTDLPGSSGMNSLMVRSWML